MALSKCQQNNDYKAIATMLSFKIEYSIRILSELSRQEQAGIVSVPLTWLRKICGNDINGLSIVMRILRNMEWVVYDKSNYLYSLNIDPGQISLYDLCMQVDDGNRTMSESLHSDSTAIELKKVFGAVKLSSFIGTAYINKPQIRTVAASKE